MFVTVGPFGGGSHRCNYRDEPPIVRVLLHTRDQLQAEARSLREASQAFGPDFQFEFQVLGQELAGRVRELEEFIDRLRPKCLAAAAHAQAAEQRREAITDDDDEE